MYMIQWYKLQLWLRVLTYYAILETTWISYRVITPPYQIPELTLKAAFQYCLFNINHGNVKCLLISGRGCNNISFADACNTQSKILASYVWISLPLSTHEDRLFSKACVKMLQRNTFLFANPRSSVKWHWLLSFSAVTATQFYPVLPVCLWVKVITLRKDLQ